MARSDRIRSEWSRVASLGDNRGIDPSLYEIADCGYETPCHLWLGSVHAAVGYATIGRNSYAHVAAYEEAHGPVPRGKILHHRCEQKTCVREDHLEPVTRAQHMKIHAKLSPDRVEEIRRATGSSRQVARQFGISKSHAWFLRRP